MAESALVEVVIAEIGTYRAADGTLVHRRLCGDGQPIVEVERGRQRIFTRELPCALVKLSDDPFWPDEQQRSEVGTQLFD